MEIKKICIICSRNFTGFNWRAEVCSHECHLQRRRNWHEVNGDKVRAKERVRYCNGGKEYYKKYEKTIDGFLMRGYRNMLSRVKGIQKLKAHLYLGKEILSKESFYKWANESKEFHKLYTNWTLNGYERKLTPSVDRIDSSKGYELDNMRWITHSENSRLGAINRNKY